MTEKIEPKDKTENRTTDDAEGNTLEIAGHSPQANTSECETHSRRHGTARRLAGLVTVALVTVGGLSLQSAGAATFLVNTGAHGSVSVPQAPEGYCNNQSVSGSTVDRYVLVRGPVVSTFIAPSGRRANIAYSIDVKNTTTGSTTMSNQQLYSITSTTGRLPDAGLTVRKTIGDQLKAHVFLAWYHPATNKILGTIYYQLDNYLNQATGPFGATSFYSATC
jgi:hypothetical protein